MCFVTMNYVSCDCKVNDFLKSLHCGKLELFHAYGYLADVYSFDFLFLKW